MFHHSQAERQAWSGALDRHRSLPHLGMLTGDADFEPSSRFRTQVATVLTGIAVQRGEAAGEVIARLEALADIEVLVVDDARRAAMSDPPSPWRDAVREAFPRTRTG
jgi:hypothetical protein